MAKKPGRTHTNYKLRTKIKEYYKRFLGKTRNTEFLIKNRKAFTAIKKYLTKKSPYLKTYLKRRITLSSHKAIIKDLIKRELVKTGKISAMPWLFSRVKTSKSMYENIDRVTAKIEYLPELLNGREIQKIRDMVINSKDLPKNTIEAVKRRLNLLEAELKKPVEKRKKVKFTNIGKIKDSLRDKLLSEVLGLRLVARTEKDCYEIKKLLDKWVKESGGIPRKETDFIKNPKSYPDISDNLKYRSIHVTYNIANVPIEIQIRSWGMQKEIDSIDRVRKKKYGNKLMSGARIRKKIQAEKLQK